MKYIIFLLILSACTAKQVQIIDDIIEGEAKTAEKVVEDISGIPQVQRMPQLNLIRF